MFLLALVAHPGYDFLTILGSHEGEGLLLEGIAGSSSPFIANKGQKARLWFRLCSCWPLQILCSPYRQSTAMLLTPYAGPRVILTVLCLLCAG